MNRSRKKIKNKFYLFGLFTILFFSMIATDAMGEEKLDYAFETPKIRALKTEMPSAKDLTEFSGLPFSSVTQKGTIPYAAKEGLPVLPVKTAKILIPPGHRVTKIFVSSGKKRQMEGHYNVEYRMRPQITTDRSQGKTSLDSEIYKSTKEFPVYCTKKSVFSASRGLLSWSSIFFLFNTFRQRVFCCIMKT